jgi:dihydroflavonol-4-reductase
LEAVEVAALESLAIVEREPRPIMTTLVTGATGFIGWHVARLLTSRYDRVRVLVRPTSQLAILENLSVEPVYGDLRNPASLAKALEGVGHVFHVAADYRLWARNPNEIYESNVQGTKHLISAAQKAGVERFVYTSSVATIAPPSPGRLSDESTPTRLEQMIGHYKRSKFLAEVEVMEAAAKGFPAVVVNPTMPVGPGDWKPTPTGRVILDFLLGRMPAYVDTGFNVVAVEDVADGHWLAAQHGRIGRRYILGGRNMTLRELLNSVAQATGRVAPTVKLPHQIALVAGYAENLVCRILRREPRIPLEGVRMARYKMFVDCSRAVQELDYKPGSVEEALARAARWYLDHKYVPEPRHGVPQIA